MPEISHKQDPSQRAPIFAWYVVAVISLGRKKLLFLFFFLQTSIPGTSEKRVKLLSIIKLTVVSQNYAHPT